VILTSHRQLSVRLLPSLPRFCATHQTSIDLSNPKTNWNKTAGYTEAETTAFAKILNSPGDDDAGKFVDIWRKLHPDDHHYTYFSYRFNCRAKGIGWRLDMCRWFTARYNATLMLSILVYAVVLSDRIVDRVRMCEIRSEIYGASDHCPIVLEVAPAIAS
jgi:AP endonuclease-1